MLVTSGGFHLLEQQQGLAQMRGNSLCHHYISLHFKAIPTFALEADQRAHMRSLDQFLHLHYEQTKEVTGVD